MPKEQFERRYWFQFQSYYIIRVVEKGAGIFEVEPQVNFKLGIQSLRAKAGAQYHQFVPQF